MPSAANITIKKADGTTDIVYAVLAASGGDNSPATFVAPGGSAVAHQPTLTVSAKWNGPRSARRVEGTLKYPYTAVGSDGVTRVIETAVGSFSFVLPVNMAAASTNEAAAQFGNLLASALIKSTLQVGYAPT